MINPENSNRPDDINLNATAGSNPSEIPPHLHDVPYDNTSLDEKFQEKIQAGESLVDTGELAQVQAGDYWSERPPAKELPREVEQLQKSNKKLKIILGSTVAAFLVAGSGFIGANVAKKGNDENTPTPTEPIVTAPAVPGVSESPTPTEEVDLLSLTNEQILESYTVDSNKIIAIPIQHTEEILSAHKSTPVSMDVKDYLSIVQNPEAKNGFMPGYKDGGKIIEGHPLEQYGANLTAYANLLLANLKIDDIDSVESYNLLKYGARDLVAGARQSQEKGGLVDPLNQDVIKATYELVKQLPAGSIATDAKITWMHWNLNDPWDLSNGTMLEYTIRSAEGEVSEHLIDVGTDRLEAFDSLDPIKSWSNVYSEPDALFVFNNK